nr:TonB-dependent receptor [Bacteroidaceae bacterium]
WETSEQIDLGFDLRLFRNRLTFSADWYKKSTKDLLVIGAPVSTIAGFSASPFNAGSIKNTGFEFDLGWQDNIKDFSYGVRVNLSTTKNKVTKIADNVERINGTEAEPITMFEAGQPAWYFYGYKYLGADPQTGEPVFEDRNNDGVIGYDDKTYIGKGIPDFAYGITLNAAWKGIDLLVFGRGVAGVDIFNRYENSTFATNRMTHFTQDRWTTSNPSGKYPRATSTVQKNFVKSDAYVFNGSYFKIKQIQLGYTLPKNLLKKTHIIENLRVYGSLEDFFTFTSYPGYDPEIVGTGNAAGTDYGAYPTAKKVIVGLNVTF